MAYADSSLLLKLYLREPETPDALAAMGRASRGAAGGGNAKGSELLFFVVEGVVVLSELFVAEAFFISSSLKRLEDVGIDGLLEDLQEFFAVVADEVDDGGIAFSELLKKRFQEAGILLDEGDDALELRELA